MLQTVLITGAGSGFGRGVALSLAALGHRVIAGCQIWPQAWDLRQEASTKGLAVETIKLDLLDVVDVKHALTYPIDVLFNNAGVAHSGTLTDVPMELVRATFDTNVFAHLDLTKKFLPMMVERGSGRIVWTSSDAGLQTPPFGGAYTASKWAIEAIAATLREELRPKGIQVLTVQPGVYGTGFNDTAIEGSSYWYDPETALLPPFPPPYTLPDQADPQPMIEEMVKIITGASNRYRTVFPQKMEEEVRRFQAAEWDVTV
ncbi:MAG: short-chain dehydrogenase [Rhizobium sp.]|nr:MAG: short-chain dehydrogenase [Rhizobium sp.]